MRSDSFWRGGKLWGAIRMGVPAGLAYALLWFATGRSLANAALSGAFFGATMGEFGAYHAWRQWPGAESLEQRTE